LNTVIRSAATTTMVQIMVIFSQFSKLLVKVTQLEGNDWREKALQIYVFVLSVSIRYGQIGIFFPIFFLLMFNGFEMRV
jgi:hypothetical protein